MLRGERPAHDDSVVFLAAPLAITVSRRIDAEANARGDRSQCRDGDAGERAAADRIAGTDRRSSGSRRRTRRTRRQSQTSDRRSMGRDVAQRQRVRRQGEGARRNRSGPAIRFRHLLQGDRRLTKPGPRDDRRARQRAASATVSRAESAGRPRRAPLVRQLLLDWQHRHWRVAHHVE